MSPADRLYFAQALYVYAGMLGLAGLMMLVGGILSIVKAVASHRFRK